MVTTKMGAGKPLELFREWHGDRPNDCLHVADCVTKERGLGRVRETPGAFEVSPIQSR
jgi:hypothetical protein